MSGKHEPLQDDLPSNVKRMVERILEKMKDSEPTYELGASDQERRDAVLAVARQVIRRAHNVDHAQLTQTDRTALLLHLGLRHAEIGPAGSAFVSLQELHATFHREAPSAG